MNQHRDWQALVEYSKYCRLCGPLSLWQLLDPALRPKEAVGNMRTSRGLFLCSDANLFTKTGGGLDLTQGPWFADPRLGYGGGGAA